jgi:hypothetical protein
MYNSGASKSGIIRLIEIIRLNLGCPFAAFSGLAALLLEACASSIFSVSA